MPYYSFTHIVLYCILILVIAPLTDFPFRGAPDYSANAESEFHAEAHEQLRVKDLPRVLRGGFEVDSNPQLPSCKAPNIPLDHRAPVVLCCIVLCSTFILR